MIMKFVTSDCAEVVYERGGNAIRVTINGYWFSRKAWSELTAELFPPAPPSYVTDPDVWLPGSVVDVVWFKDHYWFYRPVSEDGHQAFDLYVESIQYPGFYYFTVRRPESWPDLTFREIPCPLAPSQGDLDET